MAQLAPEAFDIKAAPSIPLRDEQLSVLARRLLKIDTDIDEELSCEDTTDGSHRLKQYQALCQPRAASRVACFRAVKERTAGRDGWHNE